MRRPYAVATVLLVVAVVIGVLLTRPAHNGPVLRTMVLDGFPSHMVVAPAMGRVFITSYATRNGQPGLMRILDTRTGALVRTMAEGRAPYILAVDEQTGRAFQVDDGTNVRVLDGRSGALLRTLSLGQGVTGMVLDVRSGRAFIVRASLDGHSRVEVWNMQGRRLGILSSSLSLLAVTVIEGEDRLYVSTTDANGFGLI